jgi:tetratricopeptide (TPR) repeat protein
VVATYLRLLVWPAGQNLDYDFPLSHAVGEPAVLASLGLLLAVAALGASLIALGRRTGRVEGLLAGGGIAWFFVTLSVESSVIPIRDVIFEHRAYLPGVGAALALATGLLLGVERLRLRGDPALHAALALALVAAPLGAATWRRNLVWQDDLTLWSDVVAKSPGKARPHQLLGEAHAQRGELDAAVRQYLEALRLQPRYLEAAYNLGNAYYAQRRLPQALAAFTLAVQADPGHAMAHNNRGAVLQVLGDLAGAAAAYQEALRLDPGLALARGNLARLRAAGEGAGARP